MSKADKQERRRYTSVNENQQSHSTKVDVLGRGASGPSKDALGRVTTGGSRKPSMKVVLGG